MIVAKVGSYTEAEIGRLMVGRVNAINDHVGCLGYRVARGIRRQTSMFGAADTSLHVYFRIASSM